MSQEDVSLSLDFALPPERVWAAVTDHASMGKWLGADVRMLDKGDARGVGAVRRVRRGPVTLDEEVIYADAPRRLVYRVLRGAGLSHHRGEILVEPLESGARVSWNVRIVTPIPGAASALGRGLSLALGRGLVELRGLIGG